ncbi:hypothetical protein [Thermomonospora umbrina]|nr:hypothetical protein [Thermomonospora umbrina]
MVRLYETRELRDVWQLGPRRIGEIEVTLINAGLIRPSETECGNR